MDTGLDILVLEGDDRTARDWQARRSQVNRARARFSNESLARGRQLLTTGSVSQITLGSEFIEARVASGGEPHHAVWQRMGADFLLDCSCGRSPGCEHQAALFWILTEQLGRHLPHEDAAAGSAISLPPQIGQADLEPNRDGDPEGSTAGVRLCLMLNPWEPGVRFYREQPGRSPGLAALPELESLTLNQLGALVKQCRRPDRPDWEREDRAVLRFFGERATLPQSGGIRKWSPSAADFVDFLGVLAGHPRVFDHHGQPLRVDPAQANPCLRLYLEQGKLYGSPALEPLEGAAGGQGGASWQITGEGYHWTDPTLLQQFEEELRRAGFRPTAEASLFIYPHAHADAFLEDHLPRLRALGYRIELDDHLRSLLEGRTQVCSKVRVDWSGSIDWLSISWEVRADEERLEPADIRALRIFPGRYFRLASGRMVSFDRDRLRREIDELVQMGYAPSKPGPQRIQSRFLARLVDLMLEPGQDRLEISSELLDHYRRLKRLEPHSRTSPPPTLRDRLRRYQLEGFQFLAFLERHGLGGILADDMGLGKTLQTLALLIHLRRAHGPQPSLVVCPTSVAPNWLEEAEKFTPELRAVQLQQASDVRGLDASRYDLIVTSYTLLQRHGMPFPFRCAILDEAQNIKNPRAQRTRAAKRLKARFRLALTGTPIENSVTELWSIVDFVLPGLLGTAKEFERLFARPIMREQNEERLQRLTEVVRPFLLRRLKAQVAPELPEKVEQNLYCELTSRQKKVYREVAARVRGEVHQYVREHGLARSRLHILTALTRLRQLCCHPALIDPDLASLGSGKLEAFLEVLDAISSGGHRVVVFSQFVRMLRLLREQLQDQGLPYLYLDGGTRDRKDRVRRFQSSSDHRVFLMSLRAGGTGLNLTAADYVVLYEPWWNPAVEQQAIDRIHRIGQDKRVTAYRMITRGTVEEKMLQLHNRKRSLADSLLEPHLGAEELLDLLE